MGPGGGEAAVLSGVLVRDGSGWLLVSGSLLTVPKDVAAMSQRDWRQVQPHAKAHMDHVGGIEPGATPMTGSLLPQPCLPEDRR
jgi:hypothetical protein